MKILLDKKNLILITVGDQVTTRKINSRKYKHNYITNVVFRIDFPKILDLDLKEPTAEFQKIIIDKFPIVKELNLGTVQVKLGKDDAETTHEKELAWQFLNVKEDKKVFIASNHIFIEYLNKSYINFEEFSADIELVLNAVMELYPVKIAERIGLRYINQIEIKDDNNAFDWSNLINPKLYELTQDFTSDKDKILRSMHLLEIEENGHNLKFQFGLFNSDYSSPIRRKEFALDYDCSTLANIDISDVFPIVNEFHSIIKKSLRKVFVMV